MPEYTMYPGKVNTPLTKTLDSINDTQTEIAVENADKLPDAPNICTLGTSEEAETILYEGKSSNTLTDVTRGFQGDARSWPSDTQVGRMFTEYDLKSVQDNVTDLYATKTDNTTFNNHSTRHQDGGADVINLEDLEGSSAALKTHTADYLHHLLRNKVEERDERYGWEVIEDEETGDNHLVLVREEVSE